METPVPVPTALTTTFLPLGEQVMVVPLEAGHRIDQLIVQPDAHRDPPQTGLVIAIGPDVPSVETVESDRGTPPRPYTRREFVVRPGDLVLYGRYAGIGFTLPNGTPALLMRLTELLAVEAWETRLGLNQALVEHETKTRGLVLHLATVACAHCPTPALDAERERFQAEQKAALEAEVQSWACPGSAPGVACDRSMGHDGPCGTAPTGDSTAPTAPVTHALGRDAHEAARQHATTLAERAAVVSGTVDAWKLADDLPDEEYSDLAALAERHHVSMAWLGRQAILEFVDRHRSEQLDLPLRLPLPRAARIPGDENLNAERRS